MQDGRKEEIYDELKYLSETISSQAWVLNLSIIATTWGLLIMQPGTGPGFKSFAPADAFPIFGACFVALLFNLLQYVSGYVDAQRIRRDVEKYNRQAFQYYKKAPFYIMRWVSFWVKVVATVIGAVLLVYKISERLLPLL